jgi:soluble lytic murein transglycosylase-like protein
MQIVALLTAAAKAAAVPPALLLSICYTESTFRNVVHPDDGVTASYGVCQVKLETARMFKHDVTEQDLMVPKKNARFAALYLARQLSRYHRVWSCAATAYNRGSVLEPLDINNTNCDTKYSRKVLKIWREQSWKTYRAQGRAKHPRRSLLKEAS